MIILNLNQYEILTLSSFSKIPMQKNSPLIGHYPMEMINFNYGEYNKAFNNFINNNFLKLEGDNYTLADELEAAFLLLHKPEVTVSFKRLREININEICFSFRKEFIMQYISDSSGKQHILAYPHVLPSVGSWLRKELFVDLKFEENSLNKYETELNADELLVIFIYMQLIKEKIENKNRELNESETFISLKDIKSFDNMDSMENLMFRYIGDENIKKHIQTGENLDLAIENLTSKNLILTINDEISLTSQGKDIFDPGNLRECFLVGEHLENNHNLSTINISKGGYIILKTISNANMPKIKLEIFPSNTDIKDIMKSVAPHAFSNGFGDEKKYEDKLKKEGENFLNKLKSEVNNTKVEEKTINENINSSNEIPMHNKKINISKTTDYKKSNINFEKQKYKYCQYCQTKLNIDAIYCSSCGKKQQ